MIEYIDETAGKLDTRLIEHQKSVQACDLKSTVSKHTKDSGHSIDWASVKIFGLKKTPAFTQDLRGHKHSYSVTGNEPWSGLPPSLNLWNNFAASSNVAVNNCKRHWWMDPDGFPKTWCNFQEISLQ